MQRAWAWGQVAVKTHPWVGGSKSQLWPQEAFTEGQQFSASDIGTEPWFRIPGAR